MKHISEIMTVVCKKHGITMNQGKEMNEAVLHLLPAFVGIIHHPVGVFDNGIDDEALGQSPRWA